MESVFIKEKMENEAIDETPNSVIDTDSSFESIHEITIEIEEKHESLQEKVNEQNSQEESTNDMNKQETNEEVSKLTDKFKNAHIQEQTPILDPKVQGSLQKIKFHRCFMQTENTNGSTGVTKSIFDAQHANNLPRESGKPVCNHPACECPCIHQLGSLSLCTCPCCQANRTNTQILVKNQSQQPGSSKTVTQSYAQPTQQNNYQTHGNHASVSSIDPGPLTAPLPTVQGTNNEHPISSFSYPPHQSTLAPASQQHHFPQIVQHNQHLIGTHPGAGYGTGQPNVNWYPAPNHSQMHSTTYYQPPQQPTLVSISQQHYPPQMKQHNQGWPETDPRARNGTEPRQQNMNCISNQTHNQMQATSNITNHPAPSNLPSTSASQVSHTRKKGRSRLPDEDCNEKSIKMRDYNKKQRNLVKLATKINENLDSFCEEDRVLIKRFKDEINNANGN